MKDNDERDDDQRSQQNKSVYSLVFGFILLIIVAIIIVLIYKYYNYNSSVYEKGQYKTSSPSYLKHISTSPKIKNIYGYTQI
jgi:hypothetical protein